MPACNQFIFDDRGRLACRCHNNAIVRVRLRDQTGAIVQRDFCPVHESDGLILAFSPHLLSIAYLPVLELELVDARDSMR